LAYLRALHYVRKVAAAGAHVEHHLPPDLLDDGIAASKIIAEKVVVLDTSQKNDTLAVSETRTMVEQLSKEYFWVQWF
jgi:hypothetical protein